jgi:hypothetical protein
LESHAQHADAERLGDLAHLVQVLVHLAAGQMDVFERFAGELELAARLEGDAAAAVRKRDGVLALVDSGPAERTLEPLEQGLDALPAAIGQRPQVAQARPGIAGVRTCCGPCLT